MAIRDAGTPEFNALLLEKVPEKFGGFWQRNAKGEFQAMFLFPAEWCQTACEGEVLGIALSFDEAIFMRDALARFIFESTDTLGRQVKGD